MPLIIGLSKPRHLRAAQKNNSPVMLYKSGKVKAKPASSSSTGHGKTAVKQHQHQQQDQQQHQHQHRWHRFGHFLNAIGQFSLFGSHHNLASVGGGGSGDHCKEDLPHQLHDQLPEHQRQVVAQHQHQQHQRNPPSRRRLLPHRRVAAAVSCQNLARASTHSPDDDCGDVDADGYGDPSDDEGGRPRANRVAKWATGLGHLLADPDGVGVFAEFLRGEFSEENINFWLAVEEFKRLGEPDELLSAARRIARAHIGCDAPAGVNLDGVTERELQSRLAGGQPRPDRRLFNAAQAHIFGLMRLDSYARFLKSPLYKDCLLCELKSRPLPTPTPPAGQSSLRRSEDSLLNTAPSQQQQNAGGGRRKLSRDPFLATDSDPTQTEVQGLIHKQRKQQKSDSYRSRQPSFIVAALDLDCGFSVC